MTSVAIGLRRKGLLLTSDGCDFGEGELQQHLLLIVDHVDTRPIDSDDDVVLGQIGACRDGATVKCRRETRMRRTFKRRSAVIGADGAKRHLPDERKAS